MRKALYVVFFLCGLIIGVMQRVVYKIWFDKEQKAKENKIWNMEDTRLLYDLLCYPEKIKNLTTWLEEKEYKDIILIGVGFSTEYFVRELKKNFHVLYCLDEGAYKNVLPVNEIEGVAVYKEYQEDIKADLIIVLPLAEYTDMLVKYSVKTTVPIKKLYEIINK